MTYEVTCGACGVLFPAPTHLYAMAEHAHRTVRLVLQCPDCGAFQQVAVTVNGERVPVRDEPTVLGRPER